MAEKITKEEIEHLAKLARIELKEGDVQKYQTELSAILGYIDVLSKVDTNNIEPTAQITGLSDVHATDAKNPSFPREEILKNAPDKKDGYIKVKPVLGGE